MLTDELLLRYPGYVWEKRQGAVAVMLPGHITIITQEQGKTVTYLGTPGLSTRIIIHLI